MHSDDAEQKPHPTRHKISISAARKMLGMIGNNYTDADLQEVLDALYSIAEEGYNLYQDIGPQSDQDE